MKTHDEKLNLVGHLTRLPEIAADIELNAYTRQHPLSAQLVTYIFLFV